VTIERPGVVLDAGCDLERDVLEGHVDLDQVARRERRQRRVVGLVRGGELGRVLRHHAGEAIQRQGDVVIGGVVGTGGGAHGSGRVA
jgi:hypothetical protein